MLSHVLEPINDLGFSLVECVAMRNRRDPRCKDSQARITLMRPESDEFLMRPESDEFASQLSMRISGSSVSSPFRKTRYLNNPGVAPSLGAPLKAGDPTSTLKLCRAKGEFSKSIFHGPGVIATHWTCSPCFKLRLLRESGSCTRPFCLIRIGKVLNSSLSEAILSSVLSIVSCCVGDLETSDTPTSDRNQEGRELL